MRQSQVEVNLKGGGGALREVQNVLIRETNEADSLKKRVIYITFMFCLINYGRKSNISYFKNKIQFDGRDFILYNNIIK